MEKTNIKNPIYIWAQALDNQSSDDFYLIDSGKAILIDDISFSQNIVSEMGDVNINGKDLNHFLKRFTDTGIKKIVYDYKNAKILISYSTKDKDIAGRDSNIDVFIDIKDLPRESYRSYIKSFYDGLTDFCIKTNREHSIEDINKVDTLIEIITQEKKSENQPREYTGKSQKILSKKLLKDKFYIILMLISIIVILIMVFGNKNQKDSVANNIQNSYNSKIVKS